mgnify:CR=1 FL=1
MGLYNKEIRNRILISVYAYAYEFRNESLIDDYEYDKLAQEIDVNISTNNMMLDKFFNDCYVSYSGSWILKHPEIEKIIEIYNKYFKRWGANKMNMIFTLLYTLSGLILFIMGLLAYMQTDLNIHISLILGLVGVFVFIVGAIRMNEDN